jgi:hypothetical protein
MAGNVGAVSVSGSCETVPRPQLRAGYELLTRFRYALLTML